MLGHDPVPLSGEIEPHKFYDLLSSFTTRIASIGACSS